MAPATARVTSNALRSPFTVALARPISATPLRPSALIVASAAAAPIGSVTVASSCSEPTPVVPLRSLSPRKAIFTLPALSGSVAMSRSSAPARAVPSSGARSSSRAISRWPRPVAPLGVTARLATSTEALAQPPCSAGTSTPPSALRSNWPSSFNGLVGEIAVGLEPAAHRLAVERGVEHQRQFLR